ncbi:MAG: hypothetical protein HXO65_00825 [Rothia mucilaginosa]|jgi:hypothetical protein|uniref:Uncharacterized protein n=1 Tax=Rothia mucilaginosa TaxID=43675 RepID=A0A930Q792_9MICC|nr:hypothetical protein [Rothia mucilaginosa]
MAFTATQKRDVVQSHYPTANNVAVKGNVFFLSFPDAEPIIGWLHSPIGILWIKAAVPVSVCPALRKVPPRWFIEAARPYMQGDERKKWYLYALRAAQQTFPSGNYRRWITLGEGHPFIKDCGGCFHFEIEGTEKEFYAMRTERKTVKTVKKADLLYVLTDEPGRIEYGVDG